MNINTFRKIGEERDSKLKWTDDELLEIVQVHECMVAYFRARKEYLIAASLSTDLYQYEQYLHFRGWRKNQKEQWVKE